MEALGSKEKQTGKSKHTTESQIRPLSFLGGKGHNQLHSCHFKGADSSSTEAVLFVALNSERNFFTHISLLDDGMEINIICKKLYMITFPSGLK